jgi:hypothetical protein
MEVSIPTHPKSKWTWYFFLTVDDSVIVSVKYHFDINQTPKHLILPTV